MILETKIQKKGKTKFFLISLFLGFLFFPMVVFGNHAVTNKGAPGQEVLGATSSIQFESAIKVGQPFSAKIDFRITADTQQKGTNYIGKYTVILCGGKVNFDANNDPANPCPQNRIIENQTIYPSAGNNSISIRDNSSVTFTFGVSAEKNSFTVDDKFASVLVIGETVDAQNSPAIDPGNSKTFHYVYRAASDATQIIVRPAGADEGNPDAPENKLTLEYSSKINARGGFATTTFTAKLDGTPIKSGATECNCELKWYEDGRNISIADNRNPYTTTQPVDPKLFSVTYKVKGSTAAPLTASAITGEVTHQGDRGREDKSEGSVILGLIGSIIGAIVNIIIVVVGAITTTLLLPIMRALLSIQVHDAQFASIIVSGWVIVRNIANIFFMLALILISLATLFQVEKYNYKHLLVQVVSMALLVNFSLVIARVILGIADTIQAQFIPFANPDVLNNLAHHLIVKTNLTTYTLNDVLNGSFTTIVKPMFHLVFALGAFAAFAAITAFLLIRIIAIMLLLVTSPFAYVGKIFGSGQGSNLSDKWWSEFLKYAFFTPILAFFLKLCALIAIQQAALGTYVVQVYPQSKSPLFAQFVYNNLSNVLIIACLFAGLHFAKSQNVAFGNQILDRAKKFAGTPARWAGQGAQFGAGAVKDYAQRQKDLRTLNLAKSDEEGGNTAKRLMYRAFNPKASTQAFLELGHDKNKKASSLQKAAAKNITYAAATKGVVTLYAVEEEIKKQDSADVARLSSMTGKEIRDYMHRINDTGLINKPEGRRQMRAALTAAAQAGKMADIMKVEFATKDASGKITKEGEFSEDNFYKLLNTYAGNDPDIKKFRQNLSRAGKEAGKLIQIGAENDNAEDREAEQAQYIKDADTETLGKLTFAGKAKTKEKNGQKVLTQTFVEMIDKYSTNSDAVISSRNLQYMVSPKVASDGRLVYKDDDAEGRVAFEKLMQEKPAFAKILYNRALGIKNMDQQSENIQEIPENWSITESQATTAGLQVASSGNNTYAAQLARNDRAADPNDQGGNASGNTGRNTQGGSQRNSRPDKLPQNPPVGYMSTAFIPEKPLPNAGPTNPDRASGTGPDSPKPKPGPSFADMDNNFKDLTNT